MLYLYTYVYVCVCVCKNCFAIKFILPIAILIRSLMMKYMALS